MARKKSETLTEAEQRIMRVLWDMGEATVRDITNALADKYGLAYTTVLTTTRILTDKKYVSFRKDGRTHVFFPLVSKQSARSGAIKNMLGNLFDGSPKLLAQHLIEDESLSADDLRALRQILDASPGGDVSKNKASGDNS